MYRVLYRKWRPKIFSDVIGQPQVTKTLSAQVRENRLSHAYLFTGSRGTGKTSCAKIFSKAVNCLSPVDGSPCNECEICKGIDNGTVLDIVEIDAASNRGIDDIRLLRDEANFMPSKARFRVYIIDEVHMLTIEAFNALLKTLEEPPEHVKFILATTEVHKLPATILSRCQRFDFRRIEPEIIAPRLCEIAAAEGAKLDFDAAVLIAGIADGGMRDALSLLDRALSVGSSINADDVAACAGLMGREHIYRLVEAVAKADIAESFSIFDELHKGSCDTERLCTELIEVFRSFLIIKTTEYPEKLLVGTAGELDRMKKLAALFSGEQIVYALGVLASATQAMGKTQNRRIEAEMALMRLCRPETDSGAQALIARISVLEKEIAQLKSGIMPIRTENTVSREEKLPEKKSAEQGGAAAVAASAFSADISLPDVFDAEDTVNTADSDFDFDAFMREHGANKSKAEEIEDVDNDEFDMIINNLSTDEFAAAPDVDTADMIDSRTWLKIIIDTEKSFPPLIGMLTGSSARIQGETIYIKLGDKNIRGFCNGEILGKYVGKAAGRILNKEYKIKLDD